MVPVPDIPSDPPFVGLACSFHDRLVYLLTVLQNLHYNCLSPPPVSMSSLIHVTSIPAFQYWKTVAVGLQLETQPLSCKRLYLTTPCCTLSTKLKEGLTTVTSVVLHCLRGIHFKSTQRELCFQVYQGYNASWLKLQGSEVSLDSDFQHKKCQFTSPVH